MSTTADDSLDECRHQSAAGELTDDFYRHDMARLATLTTTQRAAQARARQELAEYVDALWDDLKLRGLRPADHPDQFNAVAAMRDLTNSLYSANALNAQHAAGDPAD
ncbi:hypothetical protein [Pseudonocardia sp. GCM10023141]|uniref:hypothetical protein n=1 Tax=Pseudonocardia sp. GCM10023141 TaxID=3252653 RepID=UPI003617FD33